MQSVERSSLHPLSILRQLLPWLFALSILAGSGGVVQLVRYVGQPFPGAVMMWRAEHKMLTISWVTPTHWSGLLSGLQVDDKILCIENYNPSPDSQVYGLDPQYEKYPCTSGGVHYTEIFSTAYADDQQIDFRLDRDGNIIEVTGVPVVPFSFWMLVEMLLPSFLLGLSLLAIGLVVYRADPTNELNLIFSLFTVVAAGVIMSIVYSGRVSAKLIILPVFELVLQGPLFSLMGVVLLHLSLLISDQLSGAQWKRWALRLLYIVSLTFSAVGLYTYIGHDEPFGQQLLTAYLVFSALSLLVCGIVALVVLTLTAYSTKNRRTRYQVSIVGVAIVGFLALSIPYIHWLFISQPFVVRIDGWPYLGLSVVAIFAYAILRFQLFPTKSITLSVLLVGVFCILIANIVFIPMGQTTAFLPLLITALVVGLGLELRRGPTLLFTRELRREILDYDRVTKFSQSIGGLQAVEALIADVRRLFAELLDVEFVDAFLIQDSDSNITRIEDDLAVMPVDLSSQAVDAIAKFSDPMRSRDVDEFAAVLSRLTERYNDIQVWIPLTHHERPVGLLGLGPRWTGEPYNDQDMQLLRIFGGQITLAISNTRQIERLRETANLNRQIQEREQSKIAGEIHSTIIPYLASLGFQVEKFRKSGDEAAQVVDELQDSIAYNSARLRELIRHLRAPETLIEQGLICTISELAEQTSKQSDIPVEFATNYDDETPSLHSEASLALYQVVREALNNATKHSGASRIRVEILDNRTSITFQVTDDGMGFDVGEALADGVKGYNSLDDMRIYMESVGGELSIHSRVSDGTTIRGRIPIAS